MTQKKKGDDYEKFIYNYHKNLGDDVWLWQDIPKDILKDANLYKEINYNRKNKLKKINPQQDIGIDLLLYKDNKYIFIQCKNLKKSVKIGDIGGFLIIMKNHPNNKGILYYSNKISKQILNNDTDKQIEYICMSIPFNTKLITTNIPIYKKLDEIVNTLSIYKRLDEEHINILPKQANLIYKKMNELKHNNPIYKKLDEDSNNISITSDKYYNEIRRDYLLHDVRPKQFNNVSIKSIDNSLSNDQKMNYIYASIIACCFCSVLLIFCATPIIAVIIVIIISIYSNVR